MDISSQDTTQPISDDQELAKALAGITAEDATENTQEGVSNSLPELPGVSPNNTENNVAQIDGTGADYIETPVPPLPEVPEPVSAPISALPRPGVIQPISEDLKAEQSSIPTTPEHSPAEEMTVSEPASSELDGIRNDALNELRPLIDKVDLSSEEKFDVYIMLIRSTDDKSLIEPAHKAAQGITDEKQKAQALLDIIKEIDYLSRK